MTTLAINDAKIKLAWREKYLTDGANERGLASPRGAYRGYWLSPRLAPDTWLRLIIDPYTPGHVVDKDQFAVVADRTNGFTLSIRETTDVEFDCGGLGGLFPVGGVDESWYVYIEAAYTPNATTTASYRVEKTDPHLIASPNYDPNAVILGVIPMLAGAVIFPAFSPLDPMYARRCIPSPTARQLVADYVDGDEPWGLFDGLSKWCLGTGAEARAFAEPSIDSFALAGATKFQLSGEFYVGRDGLNTAGKYFRFMNSTATFNSPLLGSDGGRIVPSVVVYLSDGITPINPGADADAEGFYASPWLAFSFADTVDANVTGTVRVLGYKKKTLLTLNNAPAGAFPIGDMEQAAHARWVLAKAASGTPESLAAGLLSSQLVSLLGHVNDRIETIHPTAVPADWVLLWRSHGVTSDANVTKSTCSLYFGAQGVAYVVGGYINVTGAPHLGWVFAGDDPAAGDNVSMIWIMSGVGGGILTGVKSSPAAGTHWEIDTGWDMTDMQSESVVAFTGGPMMPNGGALWVPGTTVGKMPDAFNTVYPSAVDQNRYVKHDETHPVYAGFPQSRTYYNQYGVVFTSNAKLHDETTSKWECDVVGFDAIKVLISAAGIVVFKKHQADIALGALWTDALGAGGWTTAWTTGSDSGFNNSSNACMSVTGILYETIRIGWFGTAVGGAHQRFGCIGNFRNKWTTPPIAGDMTIVDHLNLWGGAGTFVVTVGDVWGIDEWGFRIYIWDAAPGLGDGYLYDGSLIIEVT